MCAFVRMEGMRFRLPFLCRMTDQLVGSSSNALKQIFINDQVVATLTVLSPFYLDFFEQNGSSNGHTNGRVNGHTVHPCMYRYAMVS